jgi:DEAD/DEAH box helicase domain-containing protein
MTTFSSIDEDLIRRQWRLVDRRLLPGREERATEVDISPPIPPLERYLQSAFGGRLWEHQIEALGKVFSGENVCLATSTASGKSAVFYAAAIREMAHHPAARVFALYPSRALTAEQEVRWSEALALAGLNQSVGRLDGSVSKEDGWRILEKCRVVVMTPDILHARVLYNVGLAEVKRALRRLRLVVIDEVHGYDGVFGSNAAFLFRRLRHAVGLLGQAPSFIAASATIHDPVGRLRALVGTDFSEVGQESDSSPRHDTAVTLLEPPKGNDFLAEVAWLCRKLLEDERRRFVVFVESRKLVETLASVLHRSIADACGSTWDGARSVLEASVLPYRAGYESDDRRAIQSRLSSGQLRGVVATSALELGLDIKGLTTAVLIGVPRSATAAVQRVGRVGRGDSGEVFVVSTGSVLDESVFADPTALLRQPPAGNPLYLSNERIQYIHALCLARQGGEHDQIVGTSEGGVSGPFFSRVSWPSGFLELCRKERLGDIPPELRAMKADANGRPNHCFPLRDVESQFDVETGGEGWRGPERLGSLSFSQVLREAYPGAIYRYMTTPYRVTAVKLNTRKVSVVRGADVHTQPLALPAQVFPSLEADDLLGAKVAGNSTLVLGRFKVRQVVTGFRQIRGSHSFERKYPVYWPEAGVAFSQPSLGRVFETTGVLVFHPAVTALSSGIRTLASGLLEAFLSVSRMERRELDCGSGRLRSRGLGLSVGDRFIALFDQTYGSLQLTAPLFDEDIWADTLDTLARAARAITPLEQESWGEALGSLRSDAALRWTEVAAGSDGRLPSRRDNRVPVIAPGSSGVSRRRNGEPFFVDGVFFSEGLNALAYRGRHSTVRTGLGYEVWRVEDIEALPGESRMGEYDTATGELVLLDDYVDEASVEEDPGIWSGCRELSEERVSGEGRSGEPSRAEVQSTGSNSSSGIPVGGGACDTSTTDLFVPGGQEGPEGAAFDGAVERDGENATLRPGSTPDQGGTSSRAAAASSWHLLGCQSVPTDGISTDLAIRGPGESFESAKATSETEAATKAADLENQNEPERLRQTAAAFQRTAEDHLSRGGKQLALKDYLAAIYLQMAADASGGGKGDSRIRFEESGMTPIEKTVGRARALAAEIGVDEVRAWEMFLSGILDLYPGPQNPLDVVDASEQFRKRYCRP